VPDVDFEAIMTAFGLIGLVFITWSGVLGLILLTLAFTLILFIPALMHASSATWCLFFVVLSAMPFAAWFTGVLIERSFGDRAETLKVISIFAPLLTVHIMFTSGAVENAFAALLRTAEAEQVAWRIATLVSIANGSALVASVSAVSVILIVGALECSSRYLFSLSAIRPFIPLEAMRPLVITLVLTMSFQLMMGLWIRELSPLTLVGLK